MKKYIVTAGIVALIIGGSVASAAYFSSSQKDALMEEGLTNNQVTSLDAQLVACRDLISRFDSEPEERALTYAWACTNGEAKCYNTHNSQNSNDWSLVGNSGNCNAQTKPECGTSASSGGMVANPEFNPANPGFGTTTLRLGSKGTQVIAVQQFLNAAGYIDVTADGSFGLATEGALKNWQKRNGLTNDGVFGSGTRSAAIRAGIVIGTTPSGDRPLWCQGTWHCDASGWQCIANTATLCNVYCVPDTQSQPCNAAQVR